MATIYDLEDRHWDYHHREARSLPGVTALVLALRIGDSSPFRFAHAELHCLQARAHLKHELQNARVPLALGCA